MGTYLITELSEEEVEGTGRTDPDHLIKATQSNRIKRTKNEKNQKPEILRVASVLFLCYVLQVIL